MKKEEEERKEREEMAREMMRIEKAFITGAATILAFGAAAVLLLIFLGVF